MLVRINKEAVIEGLQKAAGIIPPRTGAAYLRSIWLNAENGKLQVFATDSNIEFCGSYAATVETAGLAGVQGRAFVDLLRKLPNGEITLRLEAKAGLQSLKVEQGKRRYTLPVSEPEWFQKFAEFPESKAVVWTADFLQDLIDRTAYCISDDDQSGAIACFYMKPLGEGKIDACGLNGHQFAQVRFVNDDLHGRLPSEGILIQKKYLAEVKKWLGTDEIELNLGDKRLYLRTADKKESMSLPLAYYSYPDYTAFLTRLEGDANSVLILDRKEALEALDRLSIFNTENQRWVYFTLNPEEVTLSSQGQDVGTADEGLEARYTGDIPRIAFSTKNLLDVMGHFESPELTYTMTSQEGICCIKGEGDPDYLVIVMPMKIMDTTYYGEEEAE